MPQRGRRNADQVLLTALACGATVETAARTAGLSPATVYRRLQDREFNQRLKQTHADMVQRAAAMLTAAAMEAVKTLVELQNASAKATVRLGAARSVLELGMRLREHSEIVERLQALEERANKEPRWR